MKIVTIDLEKLSWNDIDLNIKKSNKSCIFGKESFDLNFKKSIDLNQLDLYQLNYGCKLNVASFISSECIITTSNKLLVH